MRKNDPNVLRELFPKETFEAIYLDYSKTKKEIANILGLSIDKLSFIANMYNLKRDNRLQYNGRSKIFEDIINKIDKSYIEDLYCNQLLNIKEISGILNVCDETTYKIIKYYNLKRNKQDVFKNTLSKTPTDKLFQEIINKISKKDIIEYYIEEDHEWEETAKHFNITTSMFDKIKSYYNIKKDKSKIYKKALDLKYEEYGSKEEYYKQLICKSFQTRINNCGSLKESYRQGFEKIRKTNLKKYGVECILNSPNIEGFYKKKNSKPNMEFAAKLNNNSIYYTQEFNLELKSYDFKIDNSLLIEINPTITHNSTWSPFGDHEGLDKKYHLNKSKIAFDNGYRCIHIFDWDDQDKIIQSLLPKEKIYARKCIIKEVNKKECDEFLNLYHFQNTCRGQNIRLGLYYNNELIQIMTFGKPRYNKNYQYELLRLCTKFNYKVIGGAEKLFNYFIKNYNPDSVISYCDNSKFKGDVYERLNMVLKSKGTPTKHWYHINECTHISHSLLLKNGFDRLFKTNYGKGTNNEE